MNPGFGNIHPEPIAKYLGALAGAIGAGMGNFGVTTDGDGRPASVPWTSTATFRPAQDHGLALRYLVEKRWLERRGGTDSFHHAHDRPVVPALRLEALRDPVGFNQHRRLYDEPRTY